MPPPVRRRRRAQTPGVMGRGFRPPARGAPGAMGRALARMLPGRMMPWTPSPDERFRVPPGDFPPSPNREWTDFGRGFGRGVRQFIDPTTSDFLMPPLPNTFSPAQGNLNPFNRYLNQSTFSGAIEGGPQFSFPMPWLDRPQIASDIGNVPNYLNPTTSAFLKGNVPNFLEKFVLPSEYSNYLNPTTSAFLNTPQLMMTDPEVRAPMAPSLTPATTMAAQPNIWDAPPASNYVRDPLQWQEAGQPFVNPLQGMAPPPSAHDIGTPPTSTAELMQRSRNTGIQGNIPPEIRAAMGPSAFSGRGGLPTGTIMESGGGPRVTDRYNRRIQKERESRGQYLAGQNRGRGGL